MSIGRIIVSGAIANKAHQGGEAWVRLNWALGLRKLGFEVLFVEQLQPGAPAGALDFFRDTMERAGLGESAILLGPDATVYGASPARMLSFAADADALINISGHLAFEPVMERVRRRVYVDIDPGFTQIWYSQGASGLGIEKHDLHFTIGENIGTDCCPIPGCGIVWRKTRPPVVLDAWPAAEAPGFNRFTTIANWRGSYGPVEFQGRTLGLKAHEFRKFIDLPKRTSLPFEIALGIHPADHADRTALGAAGWQITDPVSAAATPEAFHEYVRTSGAEFSVAQGVYVHTCSGWFSDRTAVYLASGRPALVQDTGFSRNIPTGKGLIAFSTLQEAIAGAGEITRDYARHSRAARALAEEYLDSDKVLSRFLAEIALPSPRH
jgi:hypothetical protein